jgi:integrase
MALAQAIHEAQEANMIVENAKATRTLAERLQNQNRTVRDLIAKMPKEGLAQNTLRAQTNQDNVIASAIGDKDCASVTTSDIADLIEGIIGRGKNSWAKAVRTRVVVIFKRAIELGWIEKNPAAITGGVRVKIKRKRLTIDQFNAILKEAPGVAPWLANMMLLALVSGQDRSTIAAWPRNAVKDGEAVVFRQKTKRWIAIPVALRMDAIGMTLADVIAQCKSDVISPYLIHHKKNSGKIRLGDSIFLDTISAAFTEARRNANIPDEGAPTFHELRSLSKRLYDAQGNVDTKALLGHRSEMVASMYADNRGIEPVKVKINAA